MIWSFIERFGVMGVAAVVELILANLIAPEYFGVIATVAILISILAVFVDGGFGAALVQRKNVSRTDISTVFYFNVFTAFLILGCLWFSADWFAAYFNDPLLGQVIPWLAVGICLSAFGQAQNQMMVKQLKFRELAWISFPSIVLSGILGVGMAMVGFEIWALVVLRLSRQGILSVLLWVTCPKEIQPNFRFSFQSLKRFAGLSMGIMGNTFVARLTRNLIGLVTMKVFGASELAYYNQSRFFQKTPTEPLVGVLNRVLFPVFSEIQDDNKKIKSSLRQGIPLMIFFVAPMMFFMIASARPLVLVLLNDSWLDTVSYLRIVPVIGITFSLAAIKSNVIRAKGNGKLIFVLSLIRNGLSIATICFTWQYGIMAMIVAQIVCYFINMTINDYFTRDYIGYSFTEQWSDWIPIVVIGGVSALPAYLVDYLTQESDLLILALQAIVFVVVYLTLCTAFKTSGLKSVAAMSKHATNKIQGWNSARGQVARESNHE